MGQCPVCQTDVEAKQGDMVPCPKCHTLLFMDFFGNIIVGGEQEPVMGEDPHFHTDEASSPADIELPSTEYLEVPIHQTDEAISSSDNLGEWQSSQTHPESETNENNSYFQGFPDQRPVESQNETVDQIVDFASAEGTGGPPGLYRMTIDGIDTSTLRKAILNSLQESRLGLVNSEVASEIINGRLVIQGLNPVKASFIMNSLKELPVEINWQVYEADSKPENN